MIEATVEQVRLAFTALRSMGAQKLPQKPAWRISRLLGKLKPIVAAFEETQLKFFEGLGGQSTDGGMMIPPLERNTGEEDEPWKARLEEHRVAMNNLNKEPRELNKEVVEIDYNPLPLDMFGDADGTPEHRKMTFSANDLADLGPFITDE